MQSSVDTRTALVLSGGGARAAYEVGVLKALRDIMPQHSRSPFSIYCGISGGSINAAILATNTDDFTAGVGKADAFWSELHAADVYRADPVGVAVSGGRWLVALAVGWALGSPPRALFDNTPLRQSLIKYLEFSKLDKAIAHHSLRALGITCSGYASGQCVSFFQGRADLEPWHRPQRAGAHVALGVDHIIASMAVPFLFPAERLHREYFGDGAMRELAPLSPAIRLGADRILVIGTGRMADQDSERWRSRGRPSLAETAGHVLAGIYVDRVSADIERMSQVNRMAARIPVETREREGLPWRPIDLMVVQPTERLDLLAATLLDELPWAVRAVLRGLGVRNDAGGALLSYLMFEAAYTRRLIDLGYQDAMAQRGELSVFLDLDIT
jgi:NTE family protein